MNKNAWHLWLSTTLIPLILAAAALYEGQRISAHVPTSERIAAAELQVQAMREQAIAEEAAPPHEQKYVTLDGQRYRLPEALRVQAEALDSQIQNVNGFLSHTLIKNIGYAGAALALLSFATGLSILIQAHRWKTAALQSRDVLLRRFGTSQQWMPKLLTLLLVLFATSAAMVAALESIELLQAFKGSNKVSGGFIKLHFLVVLLAGGLVYVGINAARQLSRAFAHATESMSVNGQTLDRQQAPLLWEEVARIADALQSPHPTNIIVGLEDGFYVTEQNIQLEPKSQLIKGRSLYLSAARMLVLSPEEITSIIAHELGHFAGDDTAYSQHFLPLYAKALRNHYILSQSQQNSWTDFLGPRIALRLNEHVLDAFHLAIRHWSRVREFAADQAGKSVAGGVNAASALLRYSFTQPIIAAHYHDLMHNRSELVATERFFAQTTATTLTVADTAQLEQEIPHPTDTHPPTLERAKALAGETLMQATAQAQRPIDNAGLAWLRALIPHFDGVYHDLAQGHVRLVEEETAVHRAALQDLVDTTLLPEETVVLESKPRLLRAFVAVLACATLGLFFFSWYSSIGGTHDQMQEAAKGVIFSLALGVLTIVLGAYAWRLQRRHERPLLTITHRGMECASWKRPLTWAEVEDYSIHTDHNRCLFRLRLQSGIDFGLRDRNLRRHTHRKLKREENMQLTISFRKIEGMKVLPFCELFSNYCRIGWAKNVLQKLA